MCSGGTEEGVEDRRDPELDTGYLGRPVGAGDSSRDKVSVIGLGAYRGR